MVMWLWSFHFPYYSLYFFSFFPLQLPFIRYLFLIFLVLSALVFGHIMRTIECGWMQSNDNISDEWLNWRTKSHEISYEITSDWANRCWIRGTVVTLENVMFCSQFLLLFFPLMNAFRDVIVRHLMISFFSIHVCAGFSLVYFFYWSRMGWHSFEDGSVDSIIISIEIL